MTTFESVALLLGIGALGLWIIGRRILPQEALGFLSTLALDIALPSLVFVNILVKNLLFPLCVLAALMLIRPSYHVALLATLQAAVPPVTAVPILTDRAGGNRDIVNQFMFTSFAVSLVSIPLVMWLFGVLFQPPQQVGLSCLDRGRREGREKRFFGRRLNILTFSCRVAPLSRQRAVNRKQWRHAE